MGEVREAEITAPLGVDHPTPEELIQGKARKERLGAWYATAICGNDITSSCLYVSAIAMYMRIPILKWILTLIDRVLTRFSNWREGVEEKIEAIANIRAVVFVGLGSLDRMIKAFNYLSRNEDCQNVLIFRLYTEDDPNAELNIHRNLGIIRELPPELKIEYPARKGLFNPEVVDALSRELDIPKNMMFMGSLTHTQTFSIQDLGGVRIIW